MTVANKCRSLVDQMTAFGADRKEVKAALTDAAQEIEALRYMLACRVAGAHLCSDDGELRDSTQSPFIDFKRDSAQEIERKFIERGIQRFAKDLAAQAAS